MKSTCFTLLIIAAAMGRSRGDKVELTLNKLDIKTADNAFFDAWSGEIHSPGDTLSMKIPVKAEVPDNMMVRMTGTLNGDEIPEMKKSLCEALEDDGIGKDVVKKGEPSDTFPKQCPISPNKDLKVVKYKMPADQIPPGSEGDLIAEVIVYEDEANPIITMNVEGKLESKE